MLTKLFNINSFDQNVINSDDIFQIKSFGKSIVPDESYFILRLSFENLNIKTVTYLNSLKYV